MLRNQSFLSRILTLSSGVHSMTLREEERKKFVLTLSNIKNGLKFLMLAVPILLLTTAPAPSGVSTASILFITVREMDIDSVCRVGEVGVRLREGRKLK